MMHTTEMEERLARRDEDLSQYEAGDRLSVTYREFVWDGDHIIGLEDEQQTQEFTVQRHVTHPHLNNDHLVSRGDDQITLHSNGVFSWSPYMDAWWTSVERR